MFIKKLDNELQNRWCHTVGQKQSATTGNKPAITTDYAYMHQ